MANPTADRLKQLADILRTPGYWIPKPELDFLNAVAVSHIGEDFCRKLFGTPGYLSPNGKWWTVGNGISISLDTGRFFTGHGETGTGNPVMLWRTLRDTSFLSAVEQLTDWCFEQETKPEPKPGQDTGISLNNLKRLVELAVFKDGKTSHRNSARFFWNLVQKEYGDDCLGSQYFVSATQFLKLLRTWSGAKCKALFEVKTKTFLYPNRTPRIVFTLTLTGCPLID